MEFEEIFAYIGEFGLCQFCLYMILSLVSYHNGQQAMVMVFSGYNQESWCKVRSLETYPHEHQKYVAVPYKDDSDYDSCNMYARDYGNFSDEELTNWNRSMATNASVIACPDGWVYDQSVMAVTINSEWDLVCDDNWKTEMVSTVYMIGMLVGSAFASVADRFGRQRVMVVTMLLYAAVAIACPFMPNYVAFIIMRFLTSFTNMIAFASAFVMIMEIIGPKYRVVCGVTFQLFFSVGFMVTPGVAYVIRDYAIFQLSLAVPMVVTLIGFIFLPESPRWLIFKGRYDQANKILTDIAGMNGRTLPTELNWDTQATDENKSEAESDQVKSTKKKGFLDVLKSPVLLKQLLIMWMAWFTVSLVYYGLSLNTGSYGDVFLNTFLSGLIEVPANILCFICLQKGGRRLFNSLAFIFAGVFLFALVPAMVFGGSDLEWLRVTLNTLGKGAITFAFSGVYVYVAELFPTPVRQIAVGSSSVAARVGSMLSPYMGRPLQEVWLPLPPLIFGSLSVIAGLLTLLLPETLNMMLPDTVEEAEALARGEGKQVNTTKTGQVDCRRPNGKDNVGFVDEPAADINTCQAQTKL